VRAVEQLLKKAGETMADENENKGFKDAALYGMEAGRARVAGPRVITESHTNVTAQPTHIHVHLQLNGDGSHIIEQIKKEGK
jgi:hypothetical protein